MITAKINVSLIDKEKLFEGKKGKYLDIVLIETPDGKYGDYMIKQSGSKEEKMPILGNAKIFKKQKPKSETAKDDPFEGSDLPF